MATVRVKSSKVSTSKKKVTFEVKIKGELNFTAFAARQQVNHYLIIHVGNLLHAGDPDFSVGDEGLALWNVPVIYSLPGRGTLGIVGHIWVDAQNGDLKLKASTSKEELRANAKRLYQQATSQATS
ncbi:MAG: hypothetical protein ONB46_23365 [candidate division KSB1 bacterium]|nr:hypothetical protein [candidate division KSB1 bacterium]MDZ7368807.1 hypothetical protein [candidate division KSB1 bacterium]MDZ7406651.1 hypothetical protein [candidate division KSB1 bacterium]